MSRRIFVAGHRGMVGSAIVRQLMQDEHLTLISRGRDELDLCNQAAVSNFFKDTQIDEVYLAAARVGGIHANDTYPAEFIYENLSIETNVIHHAWKNGVRKLMFLGSSCIYPRLAQQPISEAELLRGALEATNEPYAIAKIAGIKLCESYNRQYDTDYRSLMPTNLYGPGDSFHPMNSHVIPALMNRFHEAVRTSAASVSIWGSGKALREFLHVDDLARGAVHVMNLPSQDYSEVTDARLSHLNVGTSVDCSIAELSTIMARVTGYQGEIEFDTTKPDGTPRKLLDSSRMMSLGWGPEYDLEAGLRNTYRWYRENIAGIRGAEDT